MMRGADVDGDGFSNCAAFVKMMAPRMTSVEAIDYKNFDFEMWDVSGQDRSALVAALHFCTSAPCDE